MIDLSHQLHNDISTYPSDPDIKITRVKDINSDRTMLHNFSMGTHTGTHLDSPAHIIKKGKTIDKITLDKFSGVAVKVDENSYINLVGMDNIEGVIYETGWYNYFNNSQKFYG